KLGDGPVLRIGPQWNGSGICANRSMTGMQSGHQNAARWCADRTARIEIGVADTLSGEAIDVRCLNLLLSVASEFAVAEIVEHDEDDVRLANALSPGA